MSTAVWRRAAERSPATSSEHMYGRTHVKHLPTRRCVALSRNSSTSLERASTTLSCSMHRKTHEPVLWKTPLEIRHEHKHPTRMRRRGGPGMRLALVPLSPRSVGKCARVNACSFGNLVTTWDAMEQALSAAKGCLAEKSQPRGGHCSHTPHALR